MRYLLCLLLLTQHLYAQRTHMQDSIYSEIYKDYRTINISLPEKYDQHQQSYPVIYALDGARHFYILSSINEYLTTGLYPQMPQSIIVSITQKDRTNELTPPLLNLEQTNFKTAGGADKFEVFLKNELLPYIDQKYKTTNFKTLIGHSFGGLFVSYLFTKEDNVFQQKLAIDPSYWWDNMSTIDRLNYKLSSIKNTKQKYYLAKAAISEKNKDHLWDHNTAILKADSLFRKYTTEELYHFAFYENEDHGTIPVPATWDALKWFYKDYNFEVKSLLTDGNALKKHYESLSTKAGYAILPDITFIVSIDKFLMDRGKMIERKDFLNYVKSIYPNNNVVQSLKD